MPLFERYTHNVRSDGRANYRYREASQADLLMELERHGWQRNADTGAVYPPTVADARAQYMSVANAAPAIVQEQRPFCAEPVARELRLVVERALLAGTPYSTGLATYQPWHAVRIDPGSGQEVRRFVVARTAVEGGGLMADYDLLTLVGDERFERVGDDELEALLQEEEAIEQGLRSAEAEARLAAEQQAAAERRDAAQERQRAAAEERRTNEMWQSLGQVGRVARPTVIIDDFRTVASEPVDCEPASRRYREGRTVPSPFPGYDGRLP